MALPLPWGEGWGEGEETVEQPRRLNSFNRLSDFVIRISSRHAVVPAHSPRFAPVAAGRVGFRFSEFVIFDCSFQREKQQQGHAECEQEGIGLQISRLQEA